MPKPGQDKLQHELTHIGELILGRRFAEAEALARPLVQAPRPPAMARHLLGLALVHQGQADAGLAQLRAAAEAEPDNPSFAAVFGQILGELEQVNEAVAVLQEALQRHPSDLGLRLQMGSLLGRCGRPKQAMEHLSAVLKQQPDHVPALVQVAEIFASLERPDQALATFEQALRHDPDQLDARCRRGVVLESLGRQDEAVAEFRRVLERDPDHVQALSRLAALVPATDDDPRPGRLLELLRGDRLSASEAVLVSFALGKLEEDRGRHAEAFEHFERANRLRAGYRGADFDLEAYRAEVQALIDGFDAAFFVDNPGRPDAAPEPVFVVGMPRSGTTLVESIIDAHSAAAGAGELPHLRTIAHQLLSQGDADPAATIAATAPDLFQQAAQQYLQILRARAPRAQRIVDKLPHNYLNLYLVPLLFGQARVIHCRRDPRDTCLSCFLTNFDQGHGYKNDLVTLGHAYNLYARLMEHWHRVLPTPILSVRYEDLVADPEAGARRILEFLGLDWEPGCLDFPMARRMVRTASSSQVRRGVYRSSAGRWRRYEAQLQPLLDVLDRSSSD